VDHRSNRLAGPAPDGPEVHERQPLHLLDLAAEVGIRHVHHVGAGHASLLLYCYLARDGPAPSPIVRGPRRIAGPVLSPRTLVAMSAAPRIAHLGVAVESIDAALAFYRDVLGLVPGAPEQADGARIVSLPFGESEVELLEPLTPDSPIAKFMARRGPGIHHVCYQVPDLDAALAACRA